MTKEEMQSRSNAMWITELHINIINDDLAKLNHQDHVAR